MSVVSRFPVFSHSGRNRQIDNCIICPRAPKASVNSCASEVSQSVRHGPNMERAEGSTWRTPGGTVHFCKAEPPVAGANEKFMQAMMKIKHGQPDDVQKFPSVSKLQTARNRWRPGWPKLRVCLPQKKEKVDRKSVV